MRSVSFMEYARKFRVKILAGIVLLKSVGMANFMNKNVPGIRVPQDDCRDRCSGQRTCTRSRDEIAARHIRKLKEAAVCDGVHIMGDRCGGEGAGDHGAGGPVII